ncbi:MAG: hypothetical protein Kow00124_23230 [Anaerolineae bacterium]
MWGDEEWDEQDDTDAPDDGGPDTLVRLEALIADNHPALYRILLDAVEDDDAAVRIRAALALASQFHDASALPGLYEAMASGDRALQRAAADAVWEIGDEDAAGLIRALHYERGWVRDAIAEALELSGWFPDDVDTEIALRIATWNWRAIVALGEAAVPGLVSALSDPDGNVRRGIVWTLGQIGDPRAVPYLIAMLDDTAGDMFGIGERVCDAAAEALERIGTPEALDAAAAWRAMQAGGAADPTA